MKRFIRSLDKWRTASNLFVLLVTLMFFLLLSNMSSILEAAAGFYSYISPFVSGLILAYILHPVSTMYENRLLGKMKNRKAARSIGVTLTIISAIAVIALLLWAIIPGLINSVSTLVRDLDSYVDGFRQFMIQLDDKITFYDINVDEIISSTSELAKKIVVLLRDNIESIINASYKFGMGLFDAIIVFVISIYVLLDRRSLVAGTKRLLRAVFKEKGYRFVSTLAHSSNYILKNYLAGNILDAIIIGVANLIFMIITWMPNAGLISAIVGVTNLIPTFGPFIGAIPSALLLLIMSPDKVLWFIIFTIILQQIDGNVIKPVLFGDSSGLRPLWVLVSIIVFGRMFGMIGMLFGVPVFAILTQIYDLIVSSLLRNKGVDPDFGRTDEASKKKPFFARVNQSLSKWFKKIKVKIKKRHTSKKGETAGSGGGNTDDKADKNQNI